MINDLLNDLTRLDSCEKLALRGLNNNEARRSGLQKQSSLMSTGSTRSAPDSVYIDNQAQDRVSFHFCKGDGAEGTIEGSWIRQKGLGGHSGEEGQYLV